MSMFIGTKTQMATATAATLDLTLGVDELTWLNFPRPALSLYVVNPGIADALVQDGQTGLLRGRAPGSTLLVVLGNDGLAVGRWRINVGGKTRPQIAGMVTIPCIRPLEIGHRPVLAA